RVWQPEIGRMVRILRGFQGVVLATRFSRDGSRLFVADAGGMIRCFDADSDELLHEWQAHSGWVYGLDLAPDGKILASGDSTGQVRLWEPESGRPKEL
ncbi:MAG: hypothetical protein FJX77_14810, partial [Armatimonadetes bacterium]|nr:hypothetical protein [Armatimonadota bacterium]